MIFFLSFHIDRPVVRIREIINHVQTQPVYHRLRMRSQTQGHRPRPCSSEKGGGWRTYQQQHHQTKTSSHPVSLNNDQVPKTRLFCLFVFLNQKHINGSAEELLPNSAVYRNKCSLTSAYILHIFISGLDLHQQEDCCLCIQCQVYINIL